MIPDAERELKVAKRKACYLIGNSMASQMEALLQVAGKEEFCDFLYEVLDPFFREDGEPNEYLEKAIKKLRKKAKK